MTISSKPSAASPEWAQVTENAQNAVASASAMAGSIGSTLGALASHAIEGIGKHADDLTAQAGAGLQDLGDRLTESVPQAGVLGSASQAVAQTVSDGGE